MLTDSALAFLERLLDTPSPSGFEGPNARHLRDYAAPFAASVETDPLGSVIAAVNPQGNPRVMLAGHIDEIGFLVIHIADDGYLYVRPIGGHDLVNMIGQRVTVHTRKGDLPGVVGKKPIHLLDDEDKGKKIELHNLWIDIGVAGEKGKDQAKAAGVQIGDPVTYAVGMTKLQGDRITARGIDNRIGAWVVFEALRRVAERGSNTTNDKAGVYAVGTVQEEIGLRGARTSAYGVDPLIGIAVDVTFATDYPSMDKRRTSEATIGKGPCILRGANANIKLADRLIEIAEANSIPYQVQAHPNGTGTDANTMQISRAGMVTGLVEVPLRYMHTPCEIISLADADHAAELIALACASFAPGDNWTP